MNSSKSHLRKSRSRKPCKSNQVRNRSTGRCRKVPPSRASPSRRSRASPSRRSKSAVRKSRALKPCKSNQVRNRSTGRCRKVQASRASPSLRPRASPSRRPRASPSLRPRASPSRRPRASPSRRSIVLKPCKSNQVRDIQTNRCRKRKSPVRNNSPFKSIKKNTPKGKNMCCICLEKESEAIILPCSHYCFCLDCAKLIGKKCPICRRKITGINKVHTC